MILVDANILIYAYDLASPFNSRARRWLEEILNSGTRIAVSWSGIQAFLRHMTNPRIAGRPSPEAATEVVAEWLNHPQISLLTPGERHWVILSRLIQEKQAYGPLVTDAHIAALAIEHGATVCTHDRDFSRFDEIKVEYPLS